MTVFLWWMKFVKSSQCHTHPATIPQWCWSWSQFLSSLQKRLDFSIVNLDALYFQLLYAPRLAWDLISDVTWFMKQSQYYCLAVILFLATLICCPFYFWAARSIALRRCWFCCELSRLASWEPAEPQLGWPQLARCLSSLLKILPLAQDHCHLSLLLLQLYLQFIHL